MFTKIYCQNLFLLFVLAAVFIVGYTVLNVIFENSKIFRAIGIVGFIISIFGILSYTVFGREVASYDVKLTPFYSFVMAKTYPEYYRTVFMNCLLYVPFGTFLPYLLSREHKKANVIVTVLLSLIISSIIEGLQYFCSIGVYEVDDIIFNTLGGFLGTLGYLFFDYLRKKSKIKTT